MTIELARPAVEQARRCALYRHYDAGGVLLYVGISEGLMDRTIRHARTSDWARFAERAEADWHGSRELAAAAERRAIRDEVPVFNRQHAVGDVDRRIADYIEAVEARDAIDVLASYELMVKEFLNTMAPQVLAEARERAEHDFHCAGAPIDRTFPAHALRHLGDVLAPAFKDWS